MNALANSQAHALAHGAFFGSVTRTVYAKRREETTPHRTTPDLRVSVETSHHCVAYVPAASVAPSPVKPPDGMMPRAESIEHLDFEVLCEAIGAGSAACPQTEHEADWYIATHCVGPLPVCDRALKRQRALVESGRYWTSTCARCGSRRPIAPPLVLGRVRWGGAS